jgi:sugar phosphate isomerase/epimerase
MDRRTFIGTSLAAAMVAARPARTAENTHRIERVGVQLYSVRGSLEKDFEGTIAQIAKIGFREVEFAGYFGHSPQAVHTVLSQNGLTSPSAHIDYAIVEKEWPQTLDAARVIGQQYLICPWIEESQRNQPDGWKRAAELFNRAGEASRKAGIQFAYHNHTFEFQPAQSLGGKLPYDFLLEQTDPKLVKMQMDLCWITVGGGDPLTYFQRYPGRFPLVHVKDWAKGGSNNFAADLGSSVQGGHMENVGAGRIDWKRIFAESGRAGIKHYIVEHDEPKSPFDDLRQSYEYLTKLRF